MCIFMCLPNSSESRHRRYLLRVRVASPPLPQPATPGPQFATIGIMQTLTAAVLVVAAVAQPGVKRCLEKYQCRFHHDIGDTEYSWDMSGLCIESPEQNPTTAIGVCTQWMNIGPVGGGYKVCTSGSDRMIMTPGSNMTFNICEDRRVGAAACSAADRRAGARTSFAGA